MTPSTTALMLTPVEQTVEDADVARRVARLCPLLTPDHQGLTRPELMAIVEQLTDPSESGEHGT